MPKNDVLVIRLLHLKILVIRLKLLFYLLHVILTTAVNYS